MGWRGVRLLTVIASAAVATSVFAASAPAAVTADPAVTVLYVKGDSAPDQMQVDCSTGIVLVNGAPAAEGRASCADLEKLAIYGFGGDDAISLTGFFGPRPNDDSDFFGDGDEDYVELTLSAGDGNDDVASHAPFAVLNGGAGDDRVHGFAPAVFSDGGPGADTMGGASFFNVVYGGKGGDRLNGGGGFSFAFGGAGPDVFAGTRDLDLAGGGRGRDVLVGKGGPDFLLGQAGRDSLFGGAGGDLLIGNAGRDRLRGGPGKDQEVQGSPSARKIDELFGPETEELTFARRLAPRLLRP
jgi:Ca2+-binding RTX toxin-like protein